MRANEFAKAALGTLVVVEFDVIDASNAPAGFSVTKGGTGSAE